MKTRTWIVGGLALVIAVAGAAILVLERGPDDDAVPMHGDFNKRFQPRFEGLGTGSGHARTAGVGSIKDLAPVELPKP
jgi:hypothetical protein